MTEHNTDRNTPGTPDTPLDTPEVSDTRAGRLTPPVADDYYYWQHPLNREALADDMQSMYRQYGTENMLDCMADGLDHLEGELDYLEEWYEELAGKLREAAALVRKINQAD